MAKEPARIVFFLVCSYMTVACGTGSATPKRQQERQHQPAANEVVASSSKARATPDSGSPGSSLCAPAERILLSCTIEETAETASLCMSASPSDAGGYLVFRYGTPKNIHTVFPAEKRPPEDHFNRTHLSFAGNTGGYAYSFETTGTKYIVYSISGTGFDRSGIITTSSVTGAVISAMDCDPASLATDEDETSLALRPDLKADPALLDRGLPEP